MTLVRRFWLLGVGIVLFVIGGVLATIDASRVHETSFGWTAYAPISRTTFQPPGLSQFGSLPLIMMGVGLILIALWIATSRVDPAGRAMGLLRRFGVPLIGFILVAIGLVAGVQQTILPIAFSHGGADVGLLADYLSDPGVIFGPLSTSYGVTCFALAVVGIMVIAAWAGHRLRRRKVGESGATP